MCSRILSIALASLVLLFADLALGAQWRFDCEKADSAVAEGYSRLTSGDQYDPARKYGWVLGNVRSVDFGDWEPYGDGTDFYDWVMVDYEAKTKGAPPWVQSLYPAYAWLVDLSEWWIKFRQTRDGDGTGGT